MLNSETTTINGREFTATQFPATRGFKVFAKLLKLLGPGASKLMGADPTDDAGPVLQAMLANVDPDGATTLMLELLSCVTVMITDDKGRLTRMDLQDQSKVDRVFMGTFTDLFQVIFLAIKVNYAGFTNGFSLPAIQASPAAAH